MALFEAKNNGKTRLKNHLGVEGKAGRFQLRDFFEIARIYRLISKALVSKQTLDTNKIL